MLLDSFILNIGSYLAIITKRENMEIRLKLTPTKTVSLYFFYMSDKRFVSYYFLKNNKDRET